MAIEKTMSNSVVQGQKAMLDAFPVRPVLGLLQRNEGRSEQSSTSSKEIADEHRNEHLISEISTNSEEIVCGTPLSQLDDASQGSYSSSRGDDTDSLSCPKCNKTFISGANLRKHLAKLYLCDESRAVVVLPRESKLESKTCYKCDKTFTSWQGVRKHLNRIKPCHQEKEIGSTVIRRQSPAPRKCSKCGKTFSSPQSLRMHMNRVRPCDQDSKNMLDPTTPPGETSPTTLTLMSSDESSKEAKRKARAKHQARKAYLKKRGHLGEMEDPPSATCQSGDDVNRTTKTEPEEDLNRNASDETFHESDKVGSSSRGVKRPRVQREPAHEDESAGSPSDVSGLTRRRTRTPSHTTTSKKASTTEENFVHRPNKGHGGDLLAGGCSCPPCVRRWAMKLMNRMQQLEDEVLMLRQQKSTGTATTRTASTKPHVDPEATQLQSESVPPLATSTYDLSQSAGGVIKDSQAEPADIFMSLVNFSNVAVPSEPLERGVSNSEASTKPNLLLQSDGQSLHTEDGLGGLQRVDGGDEHQRVITSVAQGVNSDTQSLIDAYRHMNDQILLNERAVEESSSHVQALVGHSPTAETDFRRQVNELQESIGAEKNKRDVRVAALIAHVWKPRCEEFKSLLDAQFQNSPPDEQVYHAKWAEVASEIHTKDEIISELERQMEALAESGGRSRYAEMGELSSKIAAEYAAKMALESEREGFYVGLVKSNTRIRSLVKNALL